MLRRLSALMLGLFMLSACATPDYSEGLAKFQTGVTATNAAVGTYISSLNTYEGQVALEEWAQSGKNITPEVIEKRLTKFDQESIDVRRQSLALVQKFGDKLAELVGVDPAAGSADAAKNFTGAFETLADRVRKDSRLKDMAGPVETIVSELATIYKESLRSKALARAINSGAPVVDTILVQLEKDMREVVWPLRRTGERAVYDGMLEVYNEESAKGNWGYEKRKAFLQKVLDRYNAHQMAIATDPGAVVAATREALAELVKLANKPNDEKTVAAFVANMRAFQDRIKPLLVALQDLNAVARAN